MSNKSYPFNIVDVAIVIIISEYLYFNTLCFPKPTKENKFSKIMPFALKRIGITRE